MDTLVFDQVLTEVDSLLAELAQPLAEHRRQSGWTELTYGQATFALSGFRDRMLTKRRIPSPDRRLTGLLRALDMNGTPGDKRGDALLHRIAVLENIVRELPRDHRLRRIRSNLPPWPGSA